jgi:lariat debranching enzyme
MGLLHQLQPSYWFAAHLHVKFPAVVPHDSFEARDDQEQTKRFQRTTKFLALDKVLAGRQFLQILSIPVSDPRDSLQMDAEQPRLQYDPEWLAILRRTHNLLSTHTRDVIMPTELHTVTDEVGSK